MFFLAGSGFDLFAVNPGLIFWTVVTFLTVLLVLWKFAWKPIMEGLDARNSKIEDDLEKSKQLREEAESLLNQYKNKISKAEEEAMQIMASKKKYAEEQYNKIISKADEDSKEIVEKSKQQIESAKKQAILELEKGVIHISSKIIKKILEEDVDISKHTNLIQNELKMLR